MQPQHIFVAGYPSSIGGANTELWHTLKLWRSHGVEVTCLALWEEPDPHWRRKVDGIGCRTTVGALEDIPQIDGLAGSIVVAFCNSFFLESLRAFDKLRCRVVWVGCMTWQFPDEKLWTRVCGMLDAYVFQSDYQKAQLAPQIESLCKMGKHPFTPERLHRIPGAFDATEFAFRPRERPAEGPFVIGRLSRSIGRPALKPAVEKYPRDLWRQYEQIKELVPELEARVMGWCGGIEEHCGVPPDWVTCLGDGSETPQEFFAQCHVLVPGIGACAENWPRVGLEAMAAGVPLVVEHKGGWPEMASTVADRRAQRDIVTVFARDEKWRQQAIALGRERVEQLTGRERIFAAWRRLFTEVAG